MENSPLEIGKIPVLKGGGLFDFLKMQSSKIDCIAMEKEKETKSREEKEREEREKKNKILELLKKMGPGEVEFKFVSSDEFERAERTENIDFLYEKRKNSKPVELGLEDFGLDGFIEMLEAVDRLRKNLNEDEEEEKKEKDRKDGKKE